jgi:hypothetical protein
MLKSQVTCSYCSKIVKDPIDLPCNDSICRDHLKERDVVKQNKIKCKKCNEEFQVNDYEFKSNEALTQLIERHSHLSNEETDLKQQLENSIKKFFDFYDEFTINRTKLESSIYDHFHEMRFQVDEHSEESKKRIDDIALAMIDKIKKHEERYLKELKEKFSSFNERQSFESELSQIEETFRHPNLLISTIKEMQQRQEESLSDIQLKLDEMAKINDNLKETNQFKPNLYLFNQNETLFFGSIKLGLYSSMNSFQGEIINDEQQYLELIDLCEFSPNDKWSLLYRGTWDGFGSDVFHSKCDGHSNTLTIFKAQGSGFIFGGYTTVSWDSSDDSKSDANAFLFSLTNKDNKPLKMKIKTNNPHNAIYCHSKYGPTFGPDICIANNANTTMGSYSNLGCTYRHPQYRCGSNEVQTFLAGSFKFQLDEIEVFQRE